jgi:proline-specific peptidase
VWPLSRVKTVTAAGTIVFMNWAERGRVAVPGGEVAYGIVGTGDRTLLTLHGGPGVPSPYIHSMADLARDGMRVVFYDQLGCGRSEHPEDTSLWVMERFVEEVEAVRTALDLGQVDLWGQSFGGMLAQEYALAYPGSLRSLTLASTICSAAFHRDELARLIDAFPPETAAILRHAHRTGDTTAPGYWQASAEFWARHVCRLDPYPPELQQSTDETSAVVFSSMWGPDDVAMVGHLSNWDVSDRIAAIATPTLVTVGAYDELTPASSDMIAERIAGSELVMFHESSHHAFWEERERYMQVVGSFLTRHA